MLARFEQNLADNRCRVDHLLYETGRINEKLDQAGVQYVVIKGFSLWPEFCSDPYLRTQCDLDYLVARQSLRSAQNVLLEFGYEARRHSDVQFEYERPLQRVPSQFDSPYKLQTTPTVELHVGLWEDMGHHVPLEEPAFALDSSRLKEWGGLRFPVLSDEDALLLQVLHAFQHMLSYWVKLSWLLEIGCFIEKRWRDSLFWKRFSQRLEGAPRLAEFSTIALELTAKIFSAPMPEVAQHWRQLLRPSARSWLDNYGQRWALGERPPHKSKVFPDSKLSLLIHGDYISDCRARRDFLEHALIALEDPGQTAFRSFCAGQESAMDSSTSALGGQHIHGATAQLPWRRRVEISLGIAALAKPEKIYSVGNIPAARSFYGFVMFEDRMPIGSALRRRPRSF